MILHRPLAGEHVYNAACWCDPLIVEENDPRTQWELIAELEGPPFGRDLAYWRMYGDLL